MEDEFLVEVVREREVVKGEGALRQKPAEREVVKGTSDESMILREFDEPSSDVNEARLEGF
jgi:hypothetical protein